MSVELVFEWDEEKSNSNLKKHKVGFEEATDIFRDPLQLSVYDEEHSKHEERWVTFGISRIGRILAVMHTVNVKKSSILFRIFSARRATKNEIKEYEKRLR
ncbi:MAG: BrnT family toxin [Planctomycetes bacterium]|nr:BrnT family toxin [Planctomycetota bacterium]